MRKLLPLLLLLAGCSRSTTPAPPPVPPPTEVPRVAYTESIEKSANFPHLQRVCLSAMTVDKNNPTDLSRWHSEFGQGDTIITYLRENGYRVLILQHWLPRESIQLLRASGARVLLWCAIEAIDPPWAGRADEWFVLYNTLNRHRLKGTNGRDINIYEKSPPAEAWAIDMLWSGIVDSIPAILVDSYKLLDCDGFFIDSMMEWDYFGSATNAIPPRERSAQWTGLVGGVKSAAPDIELWGNTVGPMVPNRYGLDVLFAEHFFNGITQVEIAVSKLHSGLCLVTERSDWATHPERWRYLAHGALMNRVRDLYVCTACWTDFEPQWYWGAVTLRADSTMR